MIRCHCQYVTELYWLVYDFQYFRNLVSGAAKICMILPLINWFQNERKCLLCNIMGSAAVMNEGRHYLKSCSSSSAHNN